MSLSVQILLIQSGRKVVFCCLQGVMLMAIFVALFVLFLSPGHELMWNCLKIRVYGD